MNETLKQMVAEKGVAWVLAGLRQVTGQMADDMEALGDETDGRVGLALERIGSKIIALAVEAEQMGL